MGKALIVATVHGFISHFEKNDIRLLLNMNYEVSVACNLDGYNGELDDLNVKLINIPFSRCPYKLSNIRAYKLLKDNMISEQYDFIHCHTPVGGTIARLAAKSANISKVIYTAHGFHFYKGAPLKNWILYYPVEKWLSKYTDTLITINREDYIRARSFNAKKNEYIPGIGIDSSKYRDQVAVKVLIREELCIPKDAVILLSVGELNKNKNHQVIIRALAKLGNPNAFYIICGEGKEKENLINLSTSLGIINNVKFLGYVSEIHKMYSLADIFIFPSHREGLSVSLMEAMASGLPVICSNIRGNTDLISNSKGGYLVNPDDIDGFADRIKKVIDSSLDVVKTMGQINQETISEFDIIKVQEKMRNIYSNL